MHHLHFFFGSVANNVTDAILPATVDPVFVTNNSRVRTINPRRLIAAQAIVVDGLQAKLDYPSAYQLFRPSIYPIDTDVTAPNLPAIDYYGDTGFLLPGGEDIGVLVSRAGAAAGNVYGYLWTAERFVAAPKGGIRSLRATAAVVTTAAGVPNFGPITLDQQLPNGRYQVVGMALEGANTVAGRLIFPGQAERPGVPSNISAASHIQPLFRKGYSGVFGNFLNTNLPQLEVVGSGVTSTQTLYLDIVQLGGGIGS